MEFLPKLASTENKHMTTSTMGRPSLQELIKTAMEGSASKIDVSLETARQITNHGGTAPVEKTAAARDDHIPTNLVHKLAAASQFAARQMDPKLADANFPTHTSTGPGEGPNALGVMAATEEGDGVMEAGQSGSATAVNQPPMSPPKQKDPTRSADPATGLMTNDAMQHPEQPEEPVANEKTTLSNEQDKAAQAAYVNNLIAVGLLKTAATAEGIQLVPAHPMVKEAISMMAPVTGPMGAAGGAAQGMVSGAGKGAKRGALAGGLAGGTAGALGGGTMGALGGAALGHLTGLGAGKGALVGGGLGAVGGGLYGGAAGGAAGGLLGGGIGAAGGSIGGAGRGMKQGIGIKRASVKTAKDHTKGETTGRVVGSGAGMVGGAMAGSRLARKGGGLTRIGASLGGAMVGGHVGGRLGGAAGRAADKQLDKIDPGGKKKKASIAKIAAMMAKSANEYSPEEQERINNAGMAAGVGGATPLRLIGGALGGGVTEGTRGALRGAGGALAGNVGGAIVGSRLGRGNLLAKRIGVHAGGGVGGMLGGRSAARANIEDERSKAAIEELAALKAAQGGGEEKAASAYARNLMALGLYKQAEDALNPAQLSGGKAEATGAEPPHGASPSEEGVPSEPSDVQGQKRKMISSNDAAISYTKRDAKADPKSDVNDVLREPAQTSATDKTLDLVLDHTDEAGAKISSADLTRLAGARAVIQKLASAHKGQKGKKKKMAMGMGGAPNDPQAASGFSAAQSGM